MGKILFISVLIGFAVACVRPAIAIEERDDAKAQAEPLRRIALIGDSHVGNKKVHALGFQLAQLAKKRGIELRHEGHGGTRAVHWLKRSRWTSWLDRFDPQMVIVNLGTNEAMKNRSADELAATFQELADRLSGNGRRTVVWVTPPRLTKPKNLDNVWAALRRLKGATVLDFSESVYASRDGKHLKLAKYQLWADDIVDRLSL